MDEPRNNTGIPASDASFRNSATVQKKRRGRARWILLLILMIGGAAAYWIYRYQSVRESTDDAQIDGHINPVAARVGGMVTVVHVEENQEVAAGALLVEIDPRDFQLAVERAQAELEATEAAARAAETTVPAATITMSSQASGAQAALQSSEARVTVAARELDAARARMAPLQARLREAEAYNVKAAQDLDRMKQLIAKDRISQQQFDAAVAAADAARAAREAAAAAVTESDKNAAAAEARLEQARTGVAEARAAVEATRAIPDQLAVARANAATARARVLQARTALARARLDLEYTKIYAPVRGVIGMKNVEIGQVISKDVPLLAVVPLDDVWVTANFKEDQLMNMRVGQTAIVKVDAYGGRRYQGRVESIAAATGARFSLLPPENASGNYVKVVQRIPVKIVLDQGQDADHLLRPGMSAVPTVFCR